MADPAFEIARHVKGQAEVRGAPPLAVDLVIGAEKPRRRILPAGDKPPDRRCRAPDATGSQAGGGAGSAGPDRRSRSSAPCGGRRRPRRGARRRGCRGSRARRSGSLIRSRKRGGATAGPGILGEHQIDRGVELEKPDLGTGAVAAVLVRPKAARRFRQRGRARSRPSAASVARHRRYIAAASAPRRAPDAETTCHARRPRRGRVALRECGARAPSCGQARQSPENARRSPVAGSSPWPPAGFRSNPRVPLFSWLRGGRPGGPRIGFPSCPPRLQQRAESGHTEQPGKSDDDRQG